MPNKVSIKTKFMHGQRKIHTPTSGNYILQISSKGFGVNNMSSVTKSELHDIILRDVKDMTVS